MSYPGTFRSLFVHDPLCKLTAEEMIMHFHPRFSTPGSSRRVIEDDLIRESVDSLCRDGTVQISPKNNI